MAEDPTEVLPAAGQGLAPPPPPSADAIGRTLGKFAILERLGRGGSGDVYRAEQISLGRSVVVKVLRSEHVRTINRVERFLREAKLASRLDHPYAAHIYAFGAEPDGLLWIAMEHVRGATLDELIARRGRTPPAIFAPLFSRLCEVVHSAHELGIVHRDIKGSNVMVIERAGQLLPKLLDFGIAKVDGVEDPTGSDPDGEDTQEGQLTIEGSTLGSPQYMAPEQWASAADVDARADIYALGILAYRCVAGDLPFKNIQRRGLAEAHRTMPPPPLPDSVPQPLADAVLRALAKRPDDRWATALAFGESVRFAIGTAPPEATPIFDPYTRDVWLRAGPQPIADAVARLTSAATTVDCDAALRELVAITCRWLAVIALRSGREAESERIVTRGRSGTSPEASPALRERLRAVVGRDDALPWLELARAAEGQLPGLVAALAGADELVALASRLDDRERVRTAAGLSTDITAAADALRPIEPLLAYQLVVGRGPTAAAESWQGPRRRDREPVVVWGESIPDGEVALLDATGRVVARLSPLAQVIRPLPSAEPELFLLWRSGRGRARLVAAPWGFERDDAAAGEVLAALSTEDSDTAHDHGDETSPYPGLQAYSETDADRFVGREREVEALANRLVRAPLIAVLGPSGAGKSSFIQAGLIPRLTEGAAGYRVVTMRPGRHPMHALASLPVVSGDSEHGSALAARLRELGDSSQKGLVIVIDQLEELVTLCSDPAERTRFADVLAEAADGPSAPVRVVVTLRDDFAAVIESEASLRGRFEVFVLGTPLPEALRRIVIEPARRANVTVEPAVVDDIVAEVAGRPASLPLLSFTGAQLWRTRDKIARRITRDAYLEVGGVAGALSTYADQLYDSLANRDQRVVRDLFGRLVATDGTRIPVPRRELEQLPGAPAVLAHLIDARLLVTREEDPSSSGPDPVVEIVHECLAERWDRLARWRREDAVDRALLVDVAAATRRWQDTGHSTDRLWRGEALAELRKLLPRASLTNAERAFAAASDLADRRARKLRLGAIALAMTSLAAAALVMAYLGIEANRAADRAQTSAELAEDRLTDSLVSQGRRELNDGHELPALAYFAEALRRGSDTPALRQMIAYADRGRRWERAYVRGSAPATLASDGHQFAYGDLESHLHVLAPDGKPILDLAVHTGPTRNLQFAAGDRVIVVGEWAVTIADLARARVEATIPIHAPVLETHWGPGADEVTFVERDAFAVYGLDGTRRRELRAGTQESTEPVIDATGRWVLYHNDNHGRVVDLTTMTERLLDGDLGTPWGNPEGTARGFIDRDFDIHLVEADGKQIRTIKGAGHPGMLAFSADGKLVASVGDYQLDVYNVDGTSIGTASIEEDTGAVMIDGHDLWVGTVSGEIRHFKDMRLVGSLPGHLTEIMAFAHAGDAIASASSDGTVIVDTADAIQLVAGKAPCELPNFAAIGPMLYYECDQRAHVFFGRTELGVVDDPQPLLGTYDRTSARAAVVAGERIEIIGGGKLIARSDAGRPAGAAAIADADHVWVLDPRKALWRWTLSSNTWEHIAETPKAFAIAALDTGPAIGFIDGHVGMFENGREVRRVETDDHVQLLDVSADRRWLLATLTNGEVVVIDVASATVTRRLAGGEVMGGAAVFDDTGDLILRLTRANLTVSDRATGTDVLFNFDLMHNVLVGHGLADGRFELDSDRPALLDIPRDTRPRDAIIHAIECRVPLHVNESRLEPYTPNCNSPESLRP